MQANAAPARGLRVIAFSSFEEAESIFPAWDVLVASSANGTIFSSVEWLRSWWKAYSTPADRMLILACFDDSDLVGIAPLMFTRGEFGYRTLDVLRYLGDGSEDSDNLDIPVKQGYENTVALEVIRFVDALPASQWSICEFHTTPRSSRMLAALESAMRSCDWTVDHKERPCCYILLPTDFDQYFRSLPANQQRNVRYKTNRLSKQHQLTFRRCTSMDELPTALDRLFEMHQRRWEQRGEPGSFSSPERKNFYNTVAREFLRRGWLEFWLLEADAKIIAAQFCFRLGDTVSLLQEGFDPDYDSAGNVLRLHVLKTCIDEGVRCYDFLGGVSTPKLRWNAEVGAYRNVTAARPWTYASMYVGSTRSYRQFKDSVRRRIGDNAWNRLKRVLGRGGDDPQETSAPEKQSTQ